MYGEGDVAYMGQECADLLQELVVEDTSNINFTVLASVCNNCCKLTLGYLEICGDPEDAAGQLLTGCSFLGVECGGPDPPTGGTDPPTGGQVFYSVMTATFVLLIAKFAYLLA